MRKMFSHILIQNVFFSVLSSNIMSSWFHLVRLLCFGFLDFMWSALDCILQVCCWCCYRRLILKLQQRDRMGKKGDSDEKNGCFTSDRMGSSFFLSVLFSWTVFCLWHFCLAAFSSIYMLLFFPRLTSIFFFFLSFLGLALVFFSLVRSFAHPPLKWFFDMLDNEHLIMLTCVYY